MDYSTITGAVSFVDIFTGMGVIYASLMAVKVAMKGAVILLRSIRRF